MKILSPKQTQQLDAVTIIHEPIASIDLMERAAQSFTDWLSTMLAPDEKKIKIVCGLRNNGADGLAIARMTTMIKISKITAVETILNNRPRKRHDFRSPVQVFNNLSFNQNVIFVT